MMERALTHKRSASLVSLYYQLSSFFLVFIAVIYDQQVLLFFVVEAAVLKIFVEWSPFEPLYVCNLRPVVNILQSVGLPVLVYQVSMLEFDQSLYC